MVERQTTGDGISGSASTREGLRGMVWPIPFAVAMAVSLAARVDVVATTSPAWAPDSNGYMALAHLIGRGNVADDQGSRVPGYSLFLLAQAFHPNVVRASQELLGLLIATALFWIIWSLTRHPWLASIGALLYALNGGQILLESSILSETLATALLVGIAAALVACKTRRSPRHSLLLLMGLAAGFLPLVRPLYLFVPLVCTLPVASMVRVRSRAFWLYLAPAILPVVLWAGYLAFTFDYLGLQTDAAYGWANQAATFMKDAPDKDRVIRDIFLKQMAIAEQQTPAGMPVGSNVIWAAIPEMRKATGLSYPELGKGVQALSVQLLLSHPLGYARQVASAWVSFWKGLWVPDPGSTWRPVGAMTRPFYMLGRYLWMLVNLCFLLVVLGMLAIRAHLVRLAKLPSPAFWLVLIVLLSAIIQAAVEYGSAPRFGMPTQPYVSLVVMLAIGAWILKPRETAGASGKSIE